MNLDEKDSLRVEMLREIIVLLLSVSLESLLTDSSYVVSHFHCFEY